MSRIGNSPVPLPDKVSVTIVGQRVTVNGPRGELAHEVHPSITVKQEDGELRVTRPGDHRQHRSLHGLTRALVANMVTGVDQGFRKSLETRGVGYSAEVRGDTLVMRLGYSHDVEMEAPEGIRFTAERAPDNRYLIHVDGIDKQLVGQVAADVRRKRPPEPYKGKGVRYVGEYVRQKAGKAGKVA